MPSGSVQYLNPDGLHKNPAFTQVVVVTGPSKTLYIGTQDPVDASGTLAGPDIRSQVKQVLKNVGTALEAGGAGPEHLVHWDIYLRRGTSFQEGYEPFVEWWAGRPNPPANNVVAVEDLGRPEWLVGIDAVAVVPLDA
jgi:enamine deaminase RidA (YjgF/YER057c/UK114 family)